MTDKPFALPLPNLENVEVYAAEALGQARRCLPVLRRDVAPFLPPMDQLGARTLASHIESRTLFEERGLVEIECLLDRIDREVAKGTTEIWHSSGDYEGHVGEPTLWVERHRSPQAQRLFQAAVELRKLKDLICTVLDIMFAQRALDDLRLRV